MMQGDIWFESKLNKGSTFYFGITLDKELIENLISLEGYRETLKVLIVDDDKSLRQILEQYINEFNFSCKVVGSGEEALEEVERIIKSSEAFYDLILMDYKMPGIDGIETTLQIKSIQSIKKMPIVIMITAYKSEAVKEKARNVGIEEVLVKPIDQSMLFNAIVNIFGPKESIFGKIKQNNSINHHLFSKTSILLVEDNKINQEITKEYLTHIGIDVSVAENGLEAIEQVKNNTFDLILMDIQMPLLDGYEAAKIIKNMQSLKKMPIIAMTAHAMAEDKEKALQAGMDDYISKPFDPQILIEKMIFWLDKDISGEYEENRSDTPLEKAELNVLEALKRLGGNEKLYLELLQAFINESSFIIGKIKKSMEKEDNKSIVSELHKLKGLSGSIGAHKVMRLSDSLGQAVKIKYEKLYTIKDLEAEILVVHQRIQSILEHKRHMQGQNIRKEQDEDLNELLTQLRSFIEENSFIDESILNEVEIKIKKDKVCYESFKKLKVALDYFDYLEASKLIGEITKNRGI